MQKLNFIGIRGNLFEIITSYLTDRYQITKINSTVSEIRKVHFGVPQGSILGPLLFILYINDITNVNNDANFFLFADDTAITLSAKSHAELQRKIDNVLPSISEWFFANRLSLNTKKTMYQVYSKRKHENFDVQINGSKIERQESVKYLGVMVDENLKWKKHIYNISSVVNRNLGIMGRAKYFLSSRELLLLYNTLILPYLNYCAVVWGRNYTSTLKALVKFQKRAVRIIDKKPFRYPTGMLFKKYKILKFPDIVKEQSIMILLSFINRTLPKTIADMFQYSRPTNTRLLKHFFVPLVRTNYRKFALSYFAPKTWNKTICPLFSDIDDVPKNKATLKKYIRKFLIDRYC